MTEMKPFTGDVRVTSIRGVKGEFTTFIAVASDKRVSTGQFARYVVKASASLLNYEKVEEGQSWFVGGVVTRQARTVRHKTEIREYYLEPDEIYLKRPAGPHIVWHLQNYRVRIKNKMVKVYRGISSVKANALWECFGEDLFTLLDNGDVAGLMGCTKVTITERTANILVQGWAQYGDSEVFKWLGKRGFDRQTGEMVYEFHGEDAIRAIEENPYRLAVFSPTDWLKVDKFARKNFSVERDDSRRIRAGIESALWDLFTDGGHTCCTQETLTEKLQEKLGVEHDRIALAKVLGLLTDRYQFTSDGLVRLMEPAVMEQIVAQRITDLIKGPMSLPLNAAQVDDVIANFEQQKTDELRRKDVFNQYDIFELNKEQRLAVTTCLYNRFSVITGGAGVGKTTVLEALYALFDKVGFKRIQMALSGRAAKRMTETTGERSRTIAGYLKRFKWRRMVAKNKILNMPPEQTFLVLDETSMIDIHSMYQVIRHTPPQVRIILIGDPYQLPPVGPGLVLQDLITPRDGNPPKIPCVELSVVKRQGADSLIPRFAKLVRRGKGQWVDIVSSEPNDDISFVECERTEINQTVLRLMKDDPNNTQILCATRGSKPTKQELATKQGIEKIMKRPGSAELNALAQRMFNPNPESLDVQDYEGNWMRTGLRRGDPIMCIDNLYERGLRNGDTGRITDVYETPKLVKLKVEYADEEDVTLGADAKEIEVLSFGQIEWDDGKTREVIEQDVAHFTLSYCITVHKSQGSQYPKVIIPVIKSQILDRTLLYTAITRAKVKVILVGDKDIARKATIEQPHAFLRWVLLARSVQALLDAELDGKAETK